MRSNLTECLYTNAQKTPDKVAVWCDGKTKTYKEFTDFVSKYSNFMISNGVKYGDHIAIPMNNSIESVALFFAAAELGVCVAPLNATLPLEAIKSAMNAGDVNHLFARKSFLRDLVSNGGINIPGIVVCLDGEFENTLPFDKVNDMSTERPLVDNINGDESLILTMTSGSTGTPKPIDISQNNKYDRAMAHVRVYDITSEDSILAATPLYHSLAERLVILPLLIGATSIMLPRFTPSLWLKCVEEQKPTFTIAVSAQLAQILQEMKDKSIEITSFRSIVSSSALLEEGVKYELIEKLNCEFHEMYGTSETSTITNICFQKNKGKQASVGIPFDEADIKILRDENDTDFDRECCAGEIGEIACKTKLLCKGYYKQESMMSAQMHEGFFRTGDLGYVDEEGYLYFTGRKKELIITGAVNVYPHDIDVIVQKIPEVEECAAFSYPDDKLGEVVAIAIVPKEGIELNARTIRMYCARNLADFQQPHEIFFIDKLPKNTMGKLQRTSILEYVQEMKLDS